MDAFPHKALNTSCTSTKFTQTFAYTFYSFEKRYLTILHLGNATCITRS